MSTLPSVTYEVVDRIQGLRKRYAANWIAHEIAVCVLMACGMWLVLAAFDYVLELPRWARIAGAASGLLLLALWIAWRGTLIGSCVKRERFAAVIEHHFGEFGQRIRTVLDIFDGRAQGPEEMLSALGHQTLGRWETIAPHQVVSHRLTLLTVAFAGLAVSSIAALGYHREWKAALLRSLGGIQEYTTMQVTPGDVRLVGGDEILVGIELRGRTDRDVSLHYRMTESKDPVEQAWTEIDLIPTPAETGTNGDGVEFSAGLGKALRSLEYRFAVQSRRHSRADFSPIYRLQVEPMIEVSDCRIRVVAPAYTNIAPREFDVADVSVLQGSHVNVSLQVSHPLREARLLLGPKTTELEAAPLQAGNDPTRWSFTLPTVAGVHWRFEGTGVSGVPLSTLKGRLRVRTDHAPKINWQGPIDGIEVHTLVELPLEAEVSDDFGLSEAGIVFQIGAEDEFVLTQWSSAANDDPSGTTKSKLIGNLPLESFGLSEQEFVAYYAYAIDNREGMPQRSESDVRYIDIRPLRQFFRQAEDTQNSGLAGGFRTSLNEVIARQRTLINRTRRVVRTGSSLEQQLGIMEHLVEDQSKLAGLARFLNDRLEAQGFGNEALAMAEVLMLQAADSLAAGSFDVALTQQQEAMRALVEAKRNLREIIMARLSNQQRRALNQLLQQLRRSLRLSPIESDRDLADALGRLAREQLTLGTQVQESADEKPVMAESTDQKEPTPAAADEKQDRWDNFYDRQLELDERLREISSKLSERVLESELVASRLATAQAAMAIAAEQIKAHQPTDFTASTQQLSSDLLELSMLIASISDREPVDRLAAIGGLTGSLAGLEQGVANSQTAAVTGANQVSLTMEAKKLAVRAETLEEVLRFPLKASGDSLGAVSENLAKFLEDSQFADLLAASHAASKEIVERLSDMPETTGISQTEAESARQRSTDFADAAMQLDALYRQLVTPRLTRLREIEKQAAKLAQEMSGVDADEAEEAFETELRELELSMRAAGLLDIVAVMRGSENAQAGATPGMAGSSGSQNASQRMRSVIRLLQAHIQQLVLLDLGSDRDMVVPAQYRELVDRYLQELTGPIDQRVEEGQ